MGNKKTKKQYQNRRTQPKPKPEREVPALSPEEEEREFMERYGSGSIFKNVLKIWRDTSPLSFITYVPVILVEAVYCVAWFIASMLVFIPATRDAGIAGRDGIVFCSSVIVSFGMPLLLTFLHLRHNWREHKWYFWNAIRYVLPGCAVYLGLDLVNSVIAVLFQPDTGSLILEKLKTSMYMGIAMIAFIALIGGISQLVLLWKRNKLEPVSVRLAVGTKQNVKKKKDDDDDDEEDDD